MICPRLYRWVSVQGYHRGALVTRGQKAVLFLVSLAEPSYLTEMTRSFHAVKYINCQKDGCKKMNEQRLWIQAINKGWIGLLMILNLVEVSATLTLCLKLSRVIDCKDHHYMYLDLNVFLKNTRLCCKCWLHGHFYYLQVDIYGIVQSLKCIDIVDEKLSSKASNVISINNNFFFFLLLRRIYHQ